MFSSASTCATCIGCSVNWKCPATPMKMPTSSTNPLSGIILMMRSLRTIISAGPPALQHTGPTYGPTEYMHAGTQHAAGTHQTTGITGYCSMPCHGGCYCTLVLYTAVQSCSRWQGDVTLEVLLGKYSPRPHWQQWAEVDSSLKKAVSRCKRALRSRWDDQNATGTLSK